MEFFRSEHSKFFGAFTLVCLLLTFASQASGQAKPPVMPKASDPASGGRDDDQSPLTTFEEEIKAKRAIKLAEKEHQETLNRAKEIGDLGKQLRESFKSKTLLDRDDAKRVDRLEKLTKKIRGDAGGEDEEVKIVDRPKDIPTAACQIADAAELLSKNVQDTPRQVVSATVIGNANVLLELIRMLRGFTREVSPK